MTRAWIVAVAIMMMFTMRARGDAITLREATAPVKGCTIDDIRGGRVYFSGDRGRRHWRSVEDVVTLSFDDLKQLDEAERRLAAGDWEGALPRYVSALLVADADVERLWIHARLARLHDARREWAFAVAHAAAVVTIREDRAWVRLRPISTPSVSSPVAGLEAWRRIGHASKVVRDPTLVRLLDQMREGLRPLHTPPVREASGPPTISGFLPDDPRVQPVAPAHEPTRVKPAPRTNIAAIEAMVAEARHHAAVEACAALASDPGSTARDRFLLAYGRSLRGVGRPDDAAVMFTRCAILFETTPAAGWALYETALVYRDHHQDPETARRLLGRATRHAQTYADAELERKAQALLAKLGTTDARATDR